MATNFINPITSVAGTGVLTDIYTCPVNMEALVHGLRCANGAVGSTGVILHFTSGGVTVPLEVSTIAGETAVVMLSDKIFLKAGDVLKAESDTESVQCVAFGMERDV